MEIVKAAIGAVGSLLNQPAAGSIGSIDPATGYPVPLQGPPNLGSAGVPPPAAGGAGTFGFKDLLGLAGVVGKTIEAVRNYQLQQNLQDPNYIAKQIQQIEGRNLAALIAAEGPSIANQYGARGLSGAPGLISQGIAQAVTPEVLSAAPGEYFSGIQASENLMGGGGGLTGDIDKLLRDLYPSEQTS